MRPIYTVRSAYTGDGSTSDFTFDFKIVDLANLLVLHIDSDDVVVWQSRGNSTTYYNTVLDGEDGGTITLVSGPLPAGHQIILLFADDQPTQPANYAADSRFVTKKVEASLDRVVGQVQRIRYLLDRSLKLPEGFTGLMNVEIDNIVDDSVLVITETAPNEFVINTVPRGDFIGPQGPQGEAATIDDMTVVGELEYDDPTPMSVTNVGTIEHAMLEFVLRKGPQGEQGPQGESTVLITVSEDPPDDGIGSDGDLWMVLKSGDPTNGDFYQKTGGSYVIKGNLQGPPGGVVSIDGEDGVLTFDLSGQFSARFNKIITATTLRDALIEIYDIVYTPPSVTLNSNVGVGPYERGNAITAINFTAAVTKKSAPIAEVQFLQGASVLDTQTSGGAIPGGGNSTYAWTGSFNNTTTFSAKVTDDGSKGGPTPVTATRTFSFVLVWYAGVGAPGLNAAGVGALTKTVEGQNNNKNVSFTLGVGDVPYYAFPSSYGDLTSILDENGFESISGWTKKTGSITNAYGVAATYTWYERNTAAGVANTTNYTFKR